MLYYKVKEMGQMNKQMIKTHSTNTFRCTRNDECLSFRGFDESSAIAGVNPGVDIMSQQVRDIFCWLIWHVLIRVVNPDSEFIAAAISATAWCFYDVCWWITSVMMPVLSVMPCAEETTSLSIQRTPIRGSEGTDIYQSITLHRESY